MAVSTYLKTIAVARLLMLQRKHTSSDLCQLSMPPAPAHTARPFVAIARGHRDALRARTQRAARLSLRENAIFVAHNGTTASSLSHAPADAALLR